TPSEQPAGTPQVDRIHFLMFDATGYGGVARSVNLLASRLADTHEVHIHSLFRNRDVPPYPVDSRVAIHWLVDNRRGAWRRGRPRHDVFALPSRRRLDSDRSSLEHGDPRGSAYTDLLLRRHLPRLAPGILVTTRPMLHLAAARWASVSVLRIAQDHLNFERRMRNHYVTSMLDEAVPMVDAFVTLTEADRRDYQRRYPGTLVEQIPNASPFELRQRAPLTSKVVVSAGRLVNRKGFDRLIAAWAALAPDLPEWRLDIFGEGTCRRALEAQITTSGMSNAVRLQGFTRDLDQVLASAAVYAMSSRAEGFPMVLLEAMSHGLPLVSFDCPRGPAEIVEDGVTGRLVTDGDVGAYTRALRELISDEQRRRRMGAASYERARSYAMTTVSAQWEKLFREALDRRAPR
ncbi:MAG: glycosyltransferase family 4 protein, partial [Nocardioides sp.]|nr:glycosyltransferase family 4 protein [Nocardioides sp.]